MPREEIGANLNVLGPLFAAALLVFFSQRRGPGVYIPSSTRN